MSYLKELIPFYRSISHVDIPLPKVTDVTKQDLNRFQSLFISDNKEHNRNLHTLIIHDITNPVYRKNLTYVKELTIIDRGHTLTVGNIKDIAVSMTSVTAVNVESNEEARSMYFKELFEYLPKEKIGKVKLQGSGAVKQATDNLQRFSNLQYFEISATTDSAIINEICESVGSCKLLNELNLHAEGFSYVMGWRK